MASAENFDENRPPSTPPPAYSPTLPPMYTEQPTQRALPSFSDIVYRLITPFHATSGPAFDTTTIPDTESMDTPTLTRLSSTSPPGSPSFTPNRRERRARDQILQNTLHEARRELQREDERTERHYRHIDEYRRSVLARARDLRRRGSVPYKIRCAIKAFRNVLSMPFTTIATTLREPLSTVHAICNEPSTPRRGGFRNRLKFDTPARRRLVDFIESHDWARTATYAELSAETGLHASDSTIGRILRKEGFRRCVAHPKPWLTARQRQQRLAFAHQVSSWTIDDWFKVIWTDESAMHRGGHQRIFITRRPDERFHPHCLRPRLRDIPHTMIWACFAGVEKGPLVFWNKQEWGNITAQGFQDHIYPSLKNFYEYYNREYYMYCNAQPFDPTPSIVQMDGAPAHRAQSTRARFAADQIQLLDWPPNSPDLNPIEALWKMMKERIAQRRNKPRTEEQMQQAIREE